MKRFIKEPKVTITNNQKLIKGEILLTKETVLYNMKNQGKSPMDCNWNRDNELILPKGTKVEYIQQETKTVTSHIIRYRTNDVTVFEREVII